MTLLLWLRWFAIGWLAERLIVALVNNAGVVAYLDFGLPFVCLLIIEADRLSKENP